MNFVVWRAVAFPGICSLSTIENVKDDFELTFGYSRINGWPKNAFARMSTIRKKDIALGDVLSGTTSIVVSARLKDALTTEKANDLEFLPLTILNHKGQLASQDYFICNPQAVCDCIDQAKSQVQFNEIDPDMICGCKSLVLDENTIPKSHQIFRLKNWSPVIVVRRTLAEKLKALRLTGLYFVECERFKG